MASKGIVEWYAGKTLFVTGATGFMGKVLLEKLLRSCPDIRCIYILCRSKRGFSPAARVTEFTKLPLFDKLRKQNPSALRKIIAVEGDLTIKDLGLSAEQKDRLIQEVEVVFNGAASLRLEAGMKTAIEHNTLGTLRVLELCKAMKKLQAFVHLSTAFCHCEIEVLEETTYASPANPHDIIRICQWMDDTTLEHITPRLLGPHPNCYTYSKRLSESLISEFGQFMPCAIVRPSIVIPVMKEPLPGWVDNLNGPVGIIVGAGKGVIRSMLCVEHNRAEVVPVDIAINTTIAAACKLGIEKVNLDDPIQVYNVSAGDVSTLTWGEVLERGRKIGHEYPFEGSLWYPNGTIRTNKLAHFFVVFFLQILPAYLIDFIMVLARQKRFMVRVQNRIWVGMEVLQYFTMRNWFFKIDRTRSLVPEMNDRDKQIFYIDNIDFNVDKYLMDTILGARQYCMKEPLSSLPQARRHQAMLYWLDIITKILLVALFGWLLINWLDSAKFFLDYSSTHLQGVPILSTLIKK